MNRTQVIYVRDILDRIRRIERYTSDGREDFLASELKQDGVIRSFEVIGEVVKRLDVELLNEHPDVQWSDFAGFRDVLIHQYERIRMDLVWEYVLEDVPPLKTTIETILRELEQSEELED